ncbi:uncharacterized protein ATC70_000614 [Mucor velutinosus]|uniref:HMG box domain-containing protein n=1 Tax=Mucor velutinosus TaxID=708070 RepID=A0AAN7I1N8_9FUNG|nr:hypothetical protein ATC70_000614 [Mucor velutinosus]
MSNNKTNSLRCPHCRQSRGQLPQGDDIIFCVNCENAYLEDQGESLSSLPQTDDEFLPSQGSDEEVDEKPEESDKDEDDQNDATDDDKDDEDEFILLPPRDDVFEPSEESDDDVDAKSKESDRLNVFSDPEDSDTHVKSTARSTSKSKSKLKEKNPTKSKRKTTKRNSKTTPKVSTKLPSIFSDDILPNAKPRTEDAPENDELEFSDLSDEGGVNDYQYIPGSQQSKVRKRRRVRKQTSTSESDTDDEEEEEIITVFKRGSKDSHATREYARNNFKTAMPLKQYSTFAQFNKVMRGKLAKEHKKAIDSSGEPQKQLSRLVADAWKAMPKTEKDKFKQKLNDEKVHISSVARQKPSRPSGNGYILYSKIKLPEVKAEYPQIKTIRDLSAIVSKHWKELDDDAREGYKAKAKQEREDWIKANPEQHQQYMDKMTSRIRATKKARRDKKQGA